MAHRFLLVNRCGGILSGERLVARHLNTCQENENIKYRTTNHRSRRGNLSDFSIRVSFDYLNGFDLIRTERRDQAASLSFDQLLK